MYNNIDPVYKQIEEIILKNIETGVWPVHSKIPDEIALAEEFQVSRGTLRMALKEARQQGLLTQIRGKGTFVVSQQIEHPIGSSLISFSESMKQQGLSFKTVVLKKEVIIPDLKISALLELAPGEAVNYIERVRLSDQVPVIYLKNYMPVKYFDGLIDEDLENIPLFDCMENKYNQKIQWGRRFFRAVPALGDIVQNLGVEVASPIMQLEQIIYDKHSTPLECSTVWINSDRFDIVSILQR